MLCDMHTVGRCDSEKRQGGGDILNVQELVASSKREMAVRSEVRRKDQKNLLGMIGREGDRIKARQPVVGISFLLRG